MSAVIGDAAPRDIPFLDDRPGAMEAYAKDAFYTFLKTWVVDQPAGSQATQDQCYYSQQLKEMMMEESTTLFVNWAHLLDYNTDIAEIIASKFYRLEPSLRLAIRDFVKDMEPEYVKDENQNERDFYISIYHLGAMDRLRDLRVEKVGALCSFAGTVTRTSEVRPELFIGAFRCLECNTLVKGIEQQFKYTEPLICSNHTCGNRKHWTLVREDSTFVDWQRIKVQESVDEVPAGSLPRTMDVIVRNKQVEEAKAGDKAVFTGTLVVVPDVGACNLPSKVTVGSAINRNGGGADGFTSRAFGSREMTYRLMFIANSIQAADTRNGMVNVRPDVDQSPDEVMAGYEPRHANELQNMMADPQVYHKLVASICPSIWGHDAVKQAVLLMLLGGVHKRTPEGINLRGDINVAIVGDPACAKSQILKYVSGFLPRAVYASGKASSAAGLTATVVKEPENNEFAIEAGALMLADNGICCIDEFDKMDIKDQVAIHEAMEQQTISITKAGIQATLNARASILAAANPIGGRYDKAKPLKYNVALPPAILSRFDLLLVMIDETTEATDARIAQHIISLHKDQAEAFAGVHYTTEQIQRYIKYARSIKPELTPESADKLVHAYKELRSEDAVPGSASAYRITVRQLEALVRLSEAIARAHCSAVITPAYVDDAKRLLRSSILKVEQRDVELDEELGLGRMAIHHPEEHSIPSAAVVADDDTNMTDDNQENNPGAANGAVAPQGNGLKADAPQQQPGLNGQPAPKKAMKITATKFQAMKGMLVARMLETQEAAFRAQEQAMADAAGDGPAAAPPVEEGVRQEDLMSWYLQEQQRKGVLKTEEDMETEMTLTFKVINHLIRKDQVLAVLYRPEQRPDESNEDYLERVETERVLTLHASYNPDE